MPKPYLLLVGSLLFSSVACAQNAEDVLQETAEVYQGIEQYRFDADVSVSMEAGPQKQVVDVNMLLAARKPTHMRVQILAPNVEISLVSNGDSTWMFMPNANQYVVTEGNIESAQTGANIPDLLSEYAHIADRVESAVLLGEEDLTLEGVSRPAHVVTVAYAPRDTRAGPDSTWRTLWIDKENHLILREITRTKTAASPMGGPMEIQETTIFSKLSIGGPLPDSLFAFTPPPGATRVSREDLLAGAEGDGAGMGGSAATDFTLANLDGEQVDLAGLRGNVVLINFWATWCGPCREEMPVIQRLYERYGEGGFRVLGISLGESIDQVAPYVAEHGYTFPILLDTDGSVGSDYGAFSIPTSIIVDADGNIVHHIVGAHTEEVFLNALKDAGLQID